MLWSDAAVGLSNHQGPRDWKRMMAGMPSYMFDAVGPGRIGLSDNHAGEIVALPMQPGWGFWVREHRFLLATGNVQYDYAATGIWYYTGSGDDRETVYPVGQYADVFHCSATPGLLLLHAPGNVFIRDLRPGESLLIQPTSLLYKDLSVSMSLHVEYPHSPGDFVGWLRSYSHRHVWLRLVGPGRVAATSLFVREESSDQISGGSYSRQQW